MNAQGILTEELGLVEFESPYDLAPDRCAALLPHRHGLTCACRPECALPLTLVLGERVRPHVRRQHDLDQHSSDCVFHRDYAKISRGPDLFSAEIFNPAENDAALATGFDQFSRCVVSHGYTDSFLANRHGPHPSAVLSTIISLLTEARFIHPRESALAAAAQYGLRLVVGLVDTVTIPEVPDISPRSKWPVMVHATSSNGDRRPCCLWCSPQVLHQAGRRISVFGRTISGPYLCLSAVRPGGDVVRINLQPVGASSTQLTTVDSDAERMLLEELWAQGRSLYKPLRLSELNALPQAMRTAGTMPLAYRYRPDFVVINTSMPEVWELSGFEPGQAVTAQQYERIFTLKVGYWRTLEADGAISFRTETYRKLNRRHQLLYQN